MNIKSLVCDVMGHDVSNGIINKTIVYSYCRVCKKYNVSGLGWITEEEFRKYINDSPDENEVP